MKFKSLFKLLTLFVLTFAFVGEASALKTTLDVGDRGTFEEYRYNISKKVLTFKQNYEINDYMSKEDLNSLILLINESEGFLPDGNLINTNLKTKAITSLRKGLKFNSDVSVFQSVLDNISAYIDEARIEKIKGKIIANPVSGPAPLTVTLKGEVKDPMGSIIPEKNYIWYYYKGGKPVVLGRKRILKHVFHEEGDIYVYLAVVSNHKNKKGNIDVLSFVSRKAIEIKSKTVDFDIEVNGVKVRNKPVLKFTPEEAKRGLVFDATGSSPSKGTEFNRVEWDFGNGIEKDYRGDPKIEKVSFTKEKSYTVELKLWTNENKIAKKRFEVEIRDAIAQIETSRTTGYIGDNFTFSSRLASNEDEENFSYEWKIRNIDTGKTVYSSANGIINYTFVEKGRFTVALGVVDNYNEQDFDSVTITIASQEPVADFDNTIVSKSQPNKVFLDGTKSYDPDFQDSGRLRYTWYIAGQEAKLIDPSKDNSSGYYIFDSKGDHSVSLEVTDPDDVSSTKEDKVEIDSTLSVDFSAWPRVVSRNGTITFKANSPDARFFEWDFKDGQINKGGNRTISHKFTKAGEFDVELTVVSDDGEENVITKKVYVAPSGYPYASINLKDSTGISIENNACNGRPAFIIDRTKNVSFTGDESININGENANLDYTWKIDNKFFTSKDQSYRFDELGCSRVTLTVKDKQTLKSNSTTSWVKVINLKPTYTNISVSIQDELLDPVVVDVTANNAKDPDGVIQSYLWYYYTSTDPEPQAFRATSQNTTSFVLPKVTGRYTFVVVMKDNNDAKVSSEDDDQGYFIELEGDNINTPIVDLRVNNNSILIGQSVNFQAKVRNVLGQDISGASEYFWDFDGDGIYEKKTNTPQVTHVFKKSGTLRSKVKVKYKGISNTKTKTIDVANKLIPDFGVISIGKKFIIVDESQGDAVSKKIRFSDGKEKSLSDFVIHEFKNNKRVYLAKLKVQEGTKIEAKSKTLKPNNSNLTKVAEGGLQVFTYPPMSEEGIVTLDNENQNFVVYLGESEGDFKYYAIDYDLSRDTKLNGTKDDDVDNFTSKSYNDGTPEVITLTDNIREQKIRVFLLDEEKNPTEYIQDITVVKSYIEEVSVDKYAFDGLTDSEKVKIEKIKEYVKEFPDRYKGDSIKYIQALEAGWFDDREKTEVILNFEKFVYAIPEGDIDALDKDDIINTLESFLVEDNQEKTAKNLAYKVIKNLIPNSLENYPELIQKLDFIMQSEDEEAAKEAAKFILVGIKDSKAITNENKLQIKDSLKVILASDEELTSPEDEEQTTEVKKEDEKDFVDTILAIFSTAFKLLLWIVGGVFVILFGFYIWYLVSNKDKNVGFADFIIEKTSGNSAPKKVVTAADELDDFFAETKKPEPKKEEKKNLSVASSESTPKKEESPKTEPKKKEGNEPLNKQDGEMPAWMKGAVEKVGGVEDKKETPKAEPKKEEPKKEAPKANSDVNTDGLPSWLKQEEPKKEEKKTEPKKEETLKKVEIPKTESKKTEVKNTSNDDGLPSWLKQEEPKKEEKKPEPKKEEAPKKVETPKVESKKTEVKNTSNDDGLPSWLKQEEPKKEEKKPEPKKEETPKKVETPKAEPKKEEPKKSPKKVETKEEIPDWLKSEEKKEAPKKEVKKETKKEEKTSTKEDDSIPDWLKGAIEEDKKPKKEKTLDEKVSDDKKAIEEDNEIPDWLKGTIDESVIEEAKDELADVNTDDVVKEAKKTTPKKKTASRKKSEKSPSKPKTDEK